MMERMLWGMVCVASGYVIGYVVVTLNTYRKAFDKGWECCFDFLKESINSGYMTEDQIVYYIRNREGVTPDDRRPD